MSEKIAEIAEIFVQDEQSAWISYLWDTFNTQRSAKIEEWIELRNYIFATDTSTTSNGSLPWKNKTTRPKLCQIRDNLHSNYLSALFPNDSWLKWQSYSKEDSSHEKAKTIESYIENKARIGGLRTECSKILYDYIDYGNAFATVAYESNQKLDEDGSYVTGYVGPKLVRISPLDIVFNPLASSFEKSFKIIRSVKSLGELKKLSMVEGDQSFWGDAVRRREQLRNKLGGYSKEDFDKAIGYQADGFGNMYDYYMQDYVEILEFYGDYHNPNTEELETGKIITVVDRSYTARNVDSPTWLDHAPIYHVGWRVRQDNLWHMGPLDNLVGMQYRIDHLENIQADAMDLVVNPPLAIVGEVEDGTTWAPGAEFHLDEGGSITEISKNLQGLVSADIKIQQLQDEMELMAGAPREAMGIRTPGEKTAFEVGQLSNAAGRIFQEKITHFEIELLEKSLNAMLDISARNIRTTDTISVFDDDLGYDKFKQITKEDITANGIVRPVGARHFAKQAQDLQNLLNIFNSPIGPMVAPHTSAKAMTKFIDDVTGLKGYNIFEENIAVREQQETERTIAQAQEDLDAEDAVEPID